MLTAGYKGPHVYVLLFVHAWVSEQLRVPIYTLYACENAENYA